MHIEDNRNLDTCTSTRGATAEKNGKMKPYSVGRNLVIRLWMESCLISHVLIYICMKEI